MKDEAKHAPKADVKDAPKADAKQAPNADAKDEAALQGNPAHKKQRPPRTLQ